MNMRTPLKKVRGLGAAREGTEHFWRQRVTAAANVPLFLFFIGFLLKYNGKPIPKWPLHSTIRSWRPSWVSWSFPASST